MLSVSNFLPTKVSTEWVEEKTPSPKPTKFCPSKRFCPELEGEPLNACPTKVKALPTLKPIDQSPCLGRYCSPLEDTKLCADTAPKAKIATNDKIIFFIVIMFFLIITMQRYFFL